MPSVVSDQSSLGLPAAAAVRRLRFKPVGDCGLLVELGTRIGSQVEAQVLQLDRALTQARIPGVVEAIIGYTSLLVMFDPLTTDFDALAAAVEKLADAPPVERGARRRWRVPVAYGGAFGLDLDEVAHRLGTSTHDLTAAHAGADYRIAMFGFLPGFAYLSGLPGHLAVPRRPTPRASVFSGSIAIGGAQTAIGSIAGPCGWNVIGRTPVRTFDPERYPAAVFEPGDEIRFAPITESAFHELAERAGRGEMLAEKVA